MSDLYVCKRRSYTSINVLQLKDKQSSYKCVTDDDEYDDDGQSRTSEQKDGQAQG